MVTARRSTDIVSSAYEPAVGGVSLLERPLEEVKAQAQVSVPGVKTNYSEEEARRKRNLEKLLHYDRYTAQAVEEQSVTVTEVKEEVREETQVVAVSVALNDEDIRPTSTTMQFGDDIDQITEDMSRAQAVSAESESYSLNKKGKIVVMLYALMVSVILALIILNTSVLATLSAKTSAKAAELSATIAKYDALQDEIASITDTDYILDVAQNEYGMIKGN